MIEPSRHLEAAAPAEPSLPSPNVRTVVSFLLFVHLFTLAVGVAYNEFPSSLEQTLGELKFFQGYRQALFMDLSYTYYFTRGSDPGGELDIDHSLTADVKLADGEIRPIQFPAAGVWPGQRFRRYQMLGRRLATFSSNDAPQTATLAQTIATSLLKGDKAESLDLRLQGQLTPPAMANYRPGGAPPAKRDEYAARAFWAGDRVEVQKKEPARDTAPPPKDE
ncbi:MAG: hypothetical protein HYX69_21775 [Planctomycetia bacterium]|nr:hypothetical protein [Planctomycetia bacterium]